MSLRRKFIFVFVAFSVGLTAVGGAMTWRAASGALETELDEKLVWVAGAAAEVGLQGQWVLELRPGDENNPTWDVYHTRLRGLLDYVDEAQIFREDGTLLVSAAPADSLPIGTRLHWLDAYDAELARAWETGQATTPVFEGEDGRHYKFGFKQLDDSEAMLAVLMPADYFAPLDRLRRSVLLGSFGGALVAAFLAALLATNIVHPLERLSRAALRIQRGRMDGEVEIERGDELGRLSRAMERMRVGILQRDEQLRLMLAQVAHEIRNPLGGLELFASAAAETEDAAERERLLRRVRKEVEVLNEIIDEFLAFARPLQPEIRLHDIRVPIREAAELLEAELASTGGKLELELPAEPLLARADPAHAKRVFLNLMQNAAQAGSRVHLDARSRRGEVMVTVRDDGPGVAEELRERVFEPFVTDKEKGAGLGLAIVKRVLETNGARVELAPRNGPPGADSDDGLGAGAEFRVYFRGSEDLPRIPASPGDDRWHGS